jgi:tetratricopeptide (TPR) repeat protein
MRRTLLENDPPPPSARVRMMPEEERSQSALRRRTEPSRFRSSLEGDLDWIVMKALEKDRARRYQTASDFAADLRRHLNHEPISAGAPGRLYRLRKLARRHRVVFASTAAVALALVAGTGTSTWLYFRAQAAYREAELARRNETRLRGEADARAKIAQAALLISRDKMPEADRLVDRIEVPVTEPSLEAASVLRTLGLWNVTQGNWRGAADRFVQLERANQLDPSNTTEEITRDLLGAGPSLVVAGDLETYRRFVRETALRFAGTSDPVAAEQVIKNSLLLPADAEILDLLKPLVEVVHAAVSRHDPETPGDDRHVAWQTLALSLHQYRLGNYNEALAWARRSLEAYRDRTDARLAMTQALLALSNARLNRLQAAREALDTAMGPVNKNLPSGLERIVGQGRLATGVWHDWVISKLLIQEAQSLTTAP